MQALLVLAVVGSALAAPQFTPFTGTVPGFTPTFRTAPTTFGAAPFTQNFAAPPVTGFRSATFPGNTPTLHSRTEYLSDDGQFSSSFQQSNGHHFSETGALRPTNDHQDNVVVKSGSFGYTSPEGVPVFVTYTADEYGFHPVSSSIPQNVVPVAPTF